MSGCVVWSKIRNQPKRPARSVRVFYIVELSDTLLVLPVSRIYTFIRHGTAYSFDRQQPFHEFGHPLYILLTRSHANQLKSTVRG
jgi:hypothetical protein